MMRVITVVALAVLAMSGVAQAQDNIYGWSLSSSMSDPNVNEDAPVSGVATIYLWLECTAGAGLLGGWASMEADLEAVTYQVFGFNPLNGVLNAGGPTNLQLAVGGCPPAPFLAGSWTVFDAAGTGGSLCLIDSAANGLNVTVDCDPLNATTHANSVVGYSTLGSPCIDETAPCLVPVEAESWGSIKSLYR